MPTMFYYYFILYNLNNSREYDFFFAYHNENYSKEENSANKIP